MSNMTASLSILTAVMFLPTSPQPPTAAISTVILVVFCFVVYICSIFLFKKSYFICKGFFN